MGAIKDGVAVLAPLSVMAGGAVQAYVSSSPSGSDDEEPSRLTVALSFADWSAPASATGARLTEPPEDVWR